MQWDFLQRRR